MGLGFRGCPFGANPRRGLPKRCTLWNTISFAFSPIFNYFVIKSIKRFSEAVSSSPYGPLRLLNMRLFMRDLASIIWYSNRVIRSSEDASYISISSILLHTVVNLFIEYWCSGYFFEIIQFFYQNVQFWISHTNDLSVICDLCIWERLMGLLWQWDGVPPVWWRHWSWQPVWWR